MAKISARGATVVARVKRILRSQGGTRITLHRVLCSDGRILQRSDYLDPDGWKHRTGYVGIGKTIAVKDSWLVAQLINGWERE